jgi:hypothetical protein
VAGLGYKVFTAGEVLTAADLQGYAIDQVIAVFANETVAGSAIPSPSEGQFRFLKDIDQTQFFTGASWQAVGGGAVGFEQTFLLMGA